MSFTHFDDIYEICCDWYAPVREYPRQDILIPRDPISETLMTNTNRWWETIEKKLPVEKEREISLV